MIVSCESDQHFVPVLLFVVVVVVVFVAVAAVDFVVALKMMRLMKWVKMVHYGLNSCSGFGYCDAAGHQPVSDYLADDYPVVPDPNPQGGDDAA